MKGELYFIESNPYEASSIRSIDKVFYYGDTKFQNCLIAHSPSIGTFLALDKQIQSSEADYFVYHEALVHTCVTSLDNPKNALIIGGGEGTTAAELLKHKGIKVDWVEIDGEVVRMCRKYLPYALKKYDSRTKLIIGDGIKYIRKCRKTYDLIIGDVIEPYMNPIAEVIYNEDFARKVYARLTEQGMYVTLSWGKENGKWKNVPVPSYLKKVFPIVRPIHFYMPAFGLDFMLSIASKKNDPADTNRDKILKSIKPIKNKLKFYNEKIHSDIMLNTG